MKKTITVFLLLTVIGTMLCACGSGGGKYAERDEVGSSIDWGDGYYYDKGTHSVEKLPW